MPILPVADLSIDVDVEGHLRDCNDWSEAVAEAIAKNNDIEMSAEHWEIVKLLRNFYQKYEISPAMRILVKQVKAELGTEKGNSIHLMKLFPGSPARLATKIAGLPKPTNCL